jgi:hypothetical protein
LFTYLFFEQHIFEFRTSHMPDGCSTTWATLPAIFALFIFHMYVYHE